MATTIFEDELTLPGVITNIENDYNSSYDNSAFGTTQSVTIIGTAFDGPVGIPTPISVPEQAKYIFGDSYDSKTRREASLVAEIYDAWDKGCRTIYAVRLSGKEIYKDYEFAIESDLRLRVRGLFPSNKNKDIYMVYKTAQNQNENAGVIRIYKPATRATINEKKLGLIDDVSSILIKEIDLKGYDFTKNSKLLDVIKKVNDYADNNVIHLEIVNKDGVAVDNSKEAQDLSLGVMFPGIYTIGREKTNENIIAATDIEFVRTDVAMPYSDFDGFLWKKLSYNTDIAAPYPIYSETVQKLQQLFGETSGLIADSDYAFMKNSSSLNRLSVADKVDYEEVDIDAFEKYKKLGSGFCDTCMIQAKQGPDEQLHYRVIQTPENDENKTIGIQDGLYSILENHSTDYLVLACADAETSLHGKIPKKEEFKKTKPNTLELKVIGKESEDALIECDVKVESKDFSCPVAYKMEVCNDEEFLDSKAIINKLARGRFIRVPLIDKTKLANEYKIDDNSLALAVDCSAAFVSADLEGTEGVAEGPNYSDHVAPKLHGTLVRYNEKARKFDNIPNKYLPESVKLVADVRVDNKDILVPFKYDVKESAKGQNKEMIFVPDSGDKVLKQGDYVVASTNDCANVYLAESATKLVPVISLAELAEGFDSDEYTVVFMEKGIPALPAFIGDGKSPENIISNNTSYVKVKTNEGAWLSNFDMIDKLNNNGILKEHFEFALKNNINAIDNFPEEGLVASGTNKLEDTYDTTLYIPYTTRDNFVRQLAQHCTYATLKGVPRHGVIGSEKISAVTLANIAEKVNNMMATEFDLYAKKSNGNNMLDKDNLPYAIGQNVSLTAMQYTVTTGNNYTYTTNGAAGYAGMVSTLDPDATSTNQSINITNTAYNLSEYQITKLTAKGIVTVKDSATKGTVITDGVTLAPVNSSYRRLSTTRIINYISKLLKEAVEPYVGRTDNLATKNSINTSVKSTLNKLVGSIIDSYDFKVTSTAEEQRLGIIRINYAVVPFNEIRQIFNTIEVTH